MTGIKIRRATKKDIASLVALSMRLADEYFTVDTLYRPGYNRENEFRRFFKQAVGSRKYLVQVAEVEATGGVLACAYARVEEARKGICVSKTGYVGGLYVSPKIRKQGVATGIVDSLLRWLKEKDITIVETYVDTRNAASLKVLEKSGFAKWQHLMVARFKV